METFQEIIDEVMDIVRDPRLLQAGVSAQGTITLAGLPGVGETFTIGSHVFTFKAARATAGEVTIGVDVDATATNIATAINTDCDYFSAAANLTTNKVVVTADVNGSRIRPSDTAYGWNRVPFTIAATNCTMDGAGLFGVTTVGVWGNRVERAINRTLQQIAAGAWIDPQGRVYDICLPALETSSNVTTSASANNVALPTTFCKNLFKVYSNTRSVYIPIYKSVDLLLRQFGYLDNSGNIRAVSVKNNTLLVYQRLGVESLTLFYYQKPTTLVNHDDVPSCLPEHVAADLLVNGACYQLFSRREQGTDGQKINTQYHLTEFNKYMEQLVMYLGPPAKTPVLFPDEMVLDGMMEAGE